MATAQRATSGPARGRARRADAVLAKLALSACVTAACATAAGAEPSGLASGERRVTTSDGVSLYVKVAGQGPVCLFLHGGPGQGTYSFEHMGGAALEPFVTMVYLDQRGSGRSANARNYHLDRVVEDLEEVRRFLGVERLCLLAHSFGGVLAVSYARRYPARVTTIILANAILHLAGPAQRRAQLRAIHRLLGRPLPPLPSDDDRAALAAMHRDARKALDEAGLGYRLFSEHRRTMQRMTELDQSYRRSRGLATALGRPDAYPEYYEDHAPSTAEVAQPVLVIASRKDDLVGPDEHTRFRFPRREVVVLSGGHFSFHDASAGFVRAIRAWVAGRG